MGDKSSSFDILDGKKVRELSKSVEDFSAFLEKVFDELDVDASGKLSRSELRPAFTKIGKLLGLPPVGISAQLDELVERMFGPEGEGLDRAEFVAIMKLVLTDIASMLEEDPLFVAVFNGLVLRQLAAKPEALEAVIDKAFEALDKDKSGMLSRSELLPVLKLLSGDAGLPPAEVIEPLEEAIIAQFGGDHAELDRAEFAVLFKELVLFMADALEAAPVLQVQNATVLNGYALRKMVSDEAQFKKEAEEMFKSWDRSKQGKLSKGDVAEGLKRLGMAIGLPPMEVKEAQTIYSDLFAAADFDKSGFVEAGEFEMLLKALLLSLAAQLESSPVVVEVAINSVPSLPGSRLHDGTDLLAMLKDEEGMDKLLNERFDALDENKDGKLSKAELKPALLRLAQLLGLPPPGTQEQTDKMLDDLFRAVVSEDESEEVDRQRFVSVSKEILHGIAAGLEEAPVMAVALDGERLRGLLEDEAEFEKLCGEMFESLDTDKSGQLSMDELTPALQELGLALGIPPAGVKEEADAIVAAAVAEYGNGKMELTRAEFSMLLRDILSDIASRLASNPVVVAQSVKVLNGSRLRKLLSDEAEFDWLVTELFSDWDRSKQGRLSKGDLTAGLKKLGMAFGLPPPKAKDAERIYNNLFVTADMDDSGFVDRSELADLLRLLFVSIASELEKNPVVVEATVVSY